MYNILSFVGKHQSLDLFNGMQLPTVDLDFLTNIKDFRSFMNKNSGVYGWYDFGNKKIYIGSGKILWNRFRSYKNAFLYKKTQRINIKLMNRALKHGYENIKFFILEICNKSEEELRLLEQEYINKYNSLGKFGYNIRDTTITYKPVILNEEAIQKIKDANTGENSSNSILTDENVLKIKKLLISGVKLKPLAIKFKVSTTVISNIKRGLTWCHIKLSNEEEENLKQICKKDEKKWTSPEIIKKIKLEIQSGKCMREIAKKFNMKYTSVTGLKYGLYYKYIIP